MFSLKTKLWGIVLFSILIVFLAGCASQQASLMEDEFDTVSDNSIDAELADLFELSEAENNDQLMADDDFLNKLDSDAPFQNNNEDFFTPVDTPDSEEENLQDVLALLLEDDTDETSTSADPFPSTFDSFDSFAPTEQAESTTGLESYALESDVVRLENELEEKSLTAETLRQKIAAKNVQIEQLEKQGKTGRASVPARSAGSVSSAGFSQEYSNARSLFEAFNYTAALQAFQNLLASQPGHKMADNCQYWIGECYFGMKEYDQAVTEFTKVFNYNRKDKYDDAQLMIALSYIRSGQRDMAKQAFESFISSYPDSEYINKARNMYQKL